MSDKEQFEDIIASKFAEAEFPFYEGNWDAAEEMIDTHRKKEKRRRFAFIFSAGIAIGAMLMLPFINMLNDNSINQVAQVVEPLSEPTTNEDVDYNEASVSTASGIVEKVNVISESIVVSNVPEKVIKRIKKITDIFVPNVSTSNEPDGLPIINGEADDDAVSITNGSTTGNSASALIAFSTRRFNFDLIAVESPDSLFHLLDKTTFENAKIPMPWEFSASVGGNFVQGFSFNPIQGIEIAKPITSHLAIGVGAYYTYLSVQSGGVKKITTETTYTFGYDSEITEIKTNKLHYVVIPFYLRFTLDDNSSLIAGANTFALFTSSNLVTTYQESDGNKEGESSEKTSGYSSGINSYDIGLLFGYKRNLFGKLGASFYFNYGLMDIKKNDYYKENTFERNISGQVMLTYKL